MKWLCHKPAAAHRLFAEKWLRPETPLTISCLSAPSPMIEALLLTAARISTFNERTLLTNASGFFFEREERLYLVTSRHVLFGKTSKHFPTRIEIELHTNPDNIAESTGFSIPLYRDGKVSGATGLMRLVKSMLQSLKLTAKLCPRRQFIGPSTHDTC